MSSRGAEACALGSFPRAMMYPQHDVHIYQKFQRATHLRAKLKVTHDDGYLCASNNQNGHDQQQEREHVIELIHPQ